MNRIPRPKSPLEHPTILRLSARFHGVRAQRARVTLRCIIELGCILSVGRPIVRGQFGAWLRTLEVGNSTAERYLAIYALSRKDPASVRECGALGPMAIHRLTRLSPEGRRVVSENAKSIKSGADLIRVSAPYVRIERAVPAHRKLARLCRSVERCKEQIESLRGLKLPNPRECKTLERDLTALAAAAQHALRALARAKRRKRAA